MTLTIGTGPFGQRPAGRFNREIPAEGLEYLERSPRWIRARLGGETVVDSRRVMLLHAHGRLPVFLLPAADVRSELLPAGALEPRGDELVHVRWDAVDQWLEEEEELIGHPRDPYHRIDVRRSSRHVVVSLDGEVVADSRRPRALFETSLPTRWYLPAGDVRTELLEPSDTVTTCAYKGHPVHFSLGRHGDVAWRYDEPLNDAREVKGLIAFYNERTDIEVDGEPEERPLTQWSR